MEGMDKLKGSRKAYRSHLTRIYGKIEELNLTQPATEETTSLVISYIDQLNRKAESLQQLDTKIQSMIEGADDSERDTFESIEIQDMLIEKLTRLKRYLEKNNSTIHISQPAQSNTLEPVAPVSGMQETIVQQPSASRLPKLNLPRFSGDLLEWQTFWDSFQAAVHSNPKLTSIEKFNYLRSLLDGEASRTVSGFTLTNANYEQSVSLLEARFGKKQRIISAHMKALWNLPTPSNTASSLRQLYDTIESHIRGLESLGKSQDTYGDLLVSLILGRLPKPVIRNLTRNHPRDQWNIDELRASIEREINILESGSENHDDHSQTSITGSFFTGVRKGQSRTPSGERKVVSAKPMCVYCKGPHSAVYCNVVVDTRARLDIVKKERLCFNCLGNHKATHCNSKNRCRSCHKKHHSSLCGMDNTPTPSTSITNLENSTTQLPQPSQLSQSLNPATHSFVPTQSATNLTTTTQLLTSSQNSSPVCLLKTAIAFVRANNQRVSANILFDEGSQRTFITQALASKLDLRPHHKEDLAISSFGGDTTSKYQVDTVKITLETNDGDVAISALVVPLIATPVQNLVNSTLHKLPHLQNLKLAHPVNYVDKFQISLLIGADHYWEIVGNHIVRGSGPTAMESKLGYLLSGPLPIKSDHPITHSYTTLTANPEFSNNPENTSPTALTLMEHKICDSSQEPFMETYQRDHISRDKDGYYVVRFPWRPNHPPLPSNKTICERLTRALARKLGRQPTMLQLYGKIITEQEQRQFIERAPDENDQLVTEVHYIPHHPVYKNSSTTPVRIVYNCSCRQSPKHASLNDCLLVGDTPLIDVCAILLRFRLHQYALSTDIEKAFLHVKLDEQDRDYTRFLWLSNLNDPESQFTTYRFKVVLFGSTSSPFMLSATLHHHLDLYESPVSSDIKRNLYVDNVISGCQTEQDILSYYNDARAIMANAHFNLRSWASNSPRLQARAQADGVLDTETTVNLLGLRWNTCTDTLTLSQRQIVYDNTTAVTKRNILQAASKQYDPLGWLSPIVIRAKLLIQELWRKQVDWDDPLDDDFNNRWFQVATDVEQAASVVMARRYSVMSSNGPVFLHVFADASTKAYGAVAYLQTAEQIDFVMAKSRVSPLKTTTLPRIELRAAVVAAQLAKFIHSTLQHHFNNMEIKLWSDSQITLHWIFSKKQLKPFIANRVREICSLFPTSVWGYCHTVDNAADLLTRGITSTQLKSSTLWSRGPLWLPSQPDWPQWSPATVLHIQTSEEVESTNPTTNLPKPGLSQIIDITRYSKLTKLHRITAYMLRFITNTRQPTSRLSGQLTATELNRTQTLWIKSVQQDSFSNEIANLQSKSPRLPLVRQLRLNLNKDGIVYCGGRIHNAPVSHQAKFPYLLPQKHRLTELIVCDIHERHFHCGTNSTVTYLRQRYWLPAARQRVRSILRHCVICNRLTGRHYKAPTSPPLPKHRLQMANPFTVTGIDFSGALYVRSSNGECKAYICLFTCASSRAVHLEVLTDLSEETFLQAFRRFASRKSLPKLIISDNASTFMSAAEDLRALFKSSTVQEGLGRQGVEWKFIPCRAPWYGGYWERLIGLTKNALKKALGRAYVTLSSLQTIIVEIEAHLNNRPLTYINSDLNEPEPLTPSHLLYGRIIDTVPHSVSTEDEVIDEDYQATGSKLHNTLSKKAKAQALIIKHFWNRWKREYLVSLRETHNDKNGTTKERIKVGDVVVVHDDIPRMRWQLAVVRELQRGQDNAVRSAIIRTSNGVTSRPIVKLYPLEVNATQVRDTRDVSDNKNDRAQDTSISDNSDPQFSRPQRSAAIKARAQAADWAQILRAPEDVMD